MKSTDRAILFTRKAEPAMVDYINSNFKKMGYTHKGDMINEMLREGKASAKKKAAARKKVTKKKVTKNKVATRKKK